MKGEPARHESRPSGDDNQALQFCTTADGVRLAFRATGSGPLVIKTANWLGNLQSDGQIEATRHWVEEVSRHHRLVWYDGRGCGLSDRHVDDISFDAWLRDLEAVIDACGAERFVLLGISQGAAIAVRYAARHPDRVRGLILYASYVRGIHHQGLSAKTRAIFDELIRIAELGWGHDASTFRKLFTQHLLAQAPSSVLDAYDHVMRHSVDGATAARYMRAFYEVDARLDAPRVRCPTLVMHASGDSMILPREGELVASLVPGSRWVLTPGRNHLPLATDAAWPVLRGEMRAFLDRLDGPPPEVVQPLTPRQGEVLALVAVGLSDKAIARQLGLSPRTVEMHVARAVSALGARNRADAVSRALRARLLPEGPSSPRS